MERASSLIEEVKAVAAQLTAAERMAIIRALVVAEAAPEEQPVAPSETERLLLAEEEAWYRRPKAERMQYMGSYVAVTGGKVIDHDPDQRTLVLRMRNRRQPALIVLADWDAPPTLTVPSTHQGA